MEELIKEGNRITYLIKCEDDKETRLEFEVYQVNSWEMDDSPIKTNMDLFVKGVIKWDGCSDIYFGDEDGYLHFCGYRCFEDIKKVIDAIWYKAEKEIVRFDKGLARQ